MASSVMTEPAPQQAAPVQTEGQAAGVPLETRKKWFQNSQDSTEQSRRLSEQDRDYRDLKMWSSEELRKLRARNQPPIVIPRIPRKVDTIVGIQERSQTDPKAQPRTPNDEDAAEIATDSIRFVCDETRFKSTKRDVLENFVVEGMGGAEVTVERKRNLIDVVISRVRWEEAFYDPFSREKDFSDARYLGRAKWMHIDDVAMYGPKAVEVAKNALNSSTLVSGSFEDRPQKFAIWADRRGQRVVVVDMYYRHGEGWNRAVFCADGDLVPDGPSPYLDEDGKPTCCMEFGAVYVNRENERYGLVRGMIGPQDEINYRRSKLLHLMSNRQTFANSKAGVDVDQVKYEMGRPDGHVASQAGEFNKDFGIIPTTDMSQGQFELLQHAQNEIDLLGPNNSLQGRGSDEQSGRAWLAQQQAGMAELAMLYATFDDWCLRVYRQVWQRIRQYWDAPRYVRVTDNENAYRYIFVNEPVVDPRTGQPMIDPRTGQPAMRNRPAEMDVDIIIESSPDVTNSQQETLQMLMKMREMGDPVPMELMFQFMNVPNKRQVMDALKNNKPQPDPLEIEKLKQGHEKLQQTDAQTQADVRLKHAQAVQIEHEVMRGPVDQPAPPVDPLEIERVRQSGMTAEASARKTLAEAQGKEIENAVFSRHPSALLPQPRSVN